VISPEVNQSKPLGRGLSSIAGDAPPALRALRGDGDPGIPRTPGDMRMAGSKIKGIMQIDPAFIKRMFPG
jgi:hypothetical protein